MHLCQPGPSDDCDDDADVVMAQVRMMQGSWKLETVSQHEISISMCWSTKGRPESSEASEDDARELLTPVNPTDPGGDQPRGFLQTV